MNSIMAMFRSTRTSEFAAIFRACCRRYTTESHAATQKEAVVHPYRQIHPWKSEDEFMKSLLKNVIYNEDGIIAINKPYGIPILSIKPNANLETSAHTIVGAVNYSLQDALPYLAKELDVPILIPCLGTDKYMSGIYVFGTSSEVCKKVELGRKRTYGKYRKYWVVTTRVPNEIQGKYHLGIAQKKSPLGNQKPIILTQWSNNAVKRNEIKILNIDFKVLSNSTHNLSSLIEITSSTRKWNGMRLFASTMLYSPILGDNIYGSRIQEIMGTWLRVDPFADSCWQKPNINVKLLKLLNVTQSQQEIIPTHIHLKQVHLIYGKNKKDLIIEAPLLDPFNWTCKQLRFKLPDEVGNIDVDNEKQIAHM